MKAVIVGCGGIARSTHLPAMRRYAAAHEGFSVVACCDINAQAAADLARDFAIPHYYTDLNAMLENESPDVAVCAVSEGYNHMVGGRLLLRGIPTLIEKPLGLETSQYRHLLTCYEQSNTTHMVAFNRRFMPQYRRAKSLADGKIQYIDYAMYRVKRHETHFHTTAIHAVDAVRWLADSDYKWLEMRYQPLSYGSGVDNMFLTGMMRNNIAVTLRLCVSTGEVWEGCELHTDTQIFRAAFGVTGENEPNGDGFYQEHEEFYDCVSQGITPPSQLQDAAQSVAICEALGRREAIYRMEECG